MFFRKNIEHKKLFKLALASFVLAIFVIVLGAFTRLVDAGLGCPDWPGCYGHLLWPTDAHEVAAAEASFPEAPVDHDKTWPEVIHRYFAGTLGLFILSIAIITIREVKHTHVPPVQRIPFKLPLFLLALVILQAAFGMWTVTLKLWPKVVTAHLLGGFATLSLLWLLVQRLGGSRWQLNARQLDALQAVKPWMIAGLIVVICQIALGGWVSSNYAALACPDLPKCLNQWLPPADFKSGFNVWQDIGPNYLGGQLDNHARTAIHFSHRVGAIVVLLGLLILGFKLLQLRVTNISRWAYMLWAALLLQILLGVSNIIFALPLWVAVGHNAVGAVLLLTVISIIYRAYTATRSTGSFP